MSFGVGGYACIIPDNFINRWKELLFKQGMDCEFLHGYKPFEDDDLVLAVRVVPDSFPAAQRYGTGVERFYFQSSIRKLPHQDTDSEGNMNDILPEQEEDSDENLDDLPPHLQEIRRNAQYCYYFEHIGNSAFSTRVLLFLGATLAVITEGIMCCENEDYDNPEPRDLYLTGPEAIQYANRVMDNRFDQAEDIHNDSSEPPF